MQPVGQAILKRLLRLVRLADLLIELGNVVGDLLLGFGLCLAGERFLFFLSVFVEVPDHALPSSVCPPEHIAVAG